MDKQLMLFEGQHEVTILTKADVNFDFLGDFLILARSVATALEYARTEEVTKFCKENQVFVVKNQQISASALNRPRKLNNFGEAFITNLALNRVFGKSEMPKAAPFQDWLYEDVLPSVQKTGGYVANDDLFVNTYLKHADPETQLIFRATLETVRKQNEKLEVQQQELEYKGSVIIGLVDEIDLAEKRQILNRVVQKAGSKFQERWRELYKQFEMKYHLRLNDQLESYNKTHKPKLKNKVDYIDKVMGKIPELYEICCKLFENDVKELIGEMYSLSSR
jgi:prophage antirepressor-like protein